MRWLTSVTCFSKRAGLSSRTLRAPRTDGWRETVLTRGCATRGAAIGSARDGVVFGEDRGDLAEAQAIEDPHLRHDGAADAGNIAQPSLRDRLVQRDGESLQTFGGPLVGASAVRIAPAHRHALAEFGEQLATADASRSSMIPQPAH